MSNVRTQHDKNKPYVMLNRQAMQDPMISWEAKGLWSYLLSLPDNWNVSVAHLSQFYKGDKKRGGGEKAIYSLLKELSDHGYVSSESIKDNGKFAGRSYTVHESKISVEPKQETKKQHSPQPSLRRAVLRRAVLHRQTINNDKEELERENDINVRDDRSFDKAGSIVSFDHETYKLPNGERLSLKMRRSIAKYSESDIEKLIANVLYFEEMIAKGKTWDNPEAYLQSCIKNNYANKSRNEWENKIYAEWAKEEYKIDKLKILKTVVQFQKNYSEPAESVSYSLPPEVFSQIIQRYIDQN